MYSEREIEILSKIALKKPEEWSRNLYRLYEINNLQKDKLIEIHRMNIRITQLGRHFLCDYETALEVADKTK